MSAVVAYRRVFFLVVLSLLAPATASASFIVGRNPSNPSLQVDASGRALVSFTSGGEQQHVLVWGAVNALPPTRGKQQTAFQVDYSGGHALKLDGYFKDIKNVCKPYNGPKLEWYVAGSGCVAPDGSLWALQLWKRMLPNLGFDPWKPEQAVWELHVAHWSGEIAKLEVSQGWAWGGRFHQIFGRLTYAGKPVYGFDVTSTGSPNDSWSRNVYTDTLNPKYGPGWKRENSFLAKNPTGAFCYGFSPHPAVPPGYIGYPAPRFPPPSKGGSVPTHQGWEWLKEKPPAQWGRTNGNGITYRITVQGPGVTPDVFWTGKDIGDWNPNNSAATALQSAADDEKNRLGLNQTECHS